MTPSPARPGQPLVLAGRVRLAPSPAPSAAPLRLSVLTRSSPLVARESVAQILTHPPQGLNALPLDANASQIPTTVQAGTTTFRLSIAAEELPYSAFGVYPLSVTATVGEQTITLATVMVWQPDTLAAQPTRLGWLWPIADDPLSSGIDTLGGSTLQPQEDPKRSQVLTSTLAPTGRLGHLLEALRRANNPGGVSAVVDPALLQDVRQLADSSPPDTATAPTEVPPQAAADLSASQQSALARRWLDGLDTLSPAGSRLLLPYADADLNALAGAARQDLISLALSAPQLSQNEPGLSTQSHSWLGWTDSGYLSSPTVNALLRSNATAPAGSVPLGGLVLSDDALPSAEPATSTLTAPGKVKVGNQLVPTLRYDSQLSALVATRVDEQNPAATSAVLRQQFLAQTAMITAERPAESRAIIIAPPHRWEPNLELVSQLLSLSKEVSWLRPMTALQGFQLPSTQTWSSLHYPKTAAAGQLSSTYVKQVEQFRNSAETFVSLLSVPQVVRARVDHISLRLATSTHRSTQARIRLLADQVAALEAWQSKVSIKPSGATLAARTGPIPITVINGLDQPIRVRVALRPTLPRVIVTETPLITAAAGRRTQVNVRLHAIANGPVELQAQVQTPQGEDVGLPATITVRVSTLGPLGVLLTVGAGALFVVAVFTRTIRRRWRTRRTGVVATLGP